jgi:RNA polymerase sigma-70 factor (ECF subfamily)
MESVTSLTLLADLRDPTNSVAWLRFEDRYRPIIKAFAKKLGVRGHDVDDVAQEAVLAFVKAYSGGEYDRDKGRLRTWLFGIAHKKVIDLYRRSSKRGLADHKEMAGLEERIESRDRQEAERVWEQEWQQAVLKACLAEVAQVVEPKTLQAFELYVVQDMPAEEVATELGMSLNAVYLAKHKVIKHIRKVRETMDELL